MKTVLCAATLLAATALTGYAGSPSFNGLYVGGTIAGVSTKYNVDKNDLSYIHNIPLHVHALDNKNGTFLNGMYVGYGATFDSFYVGIEGSILKDFGNKTFERTASLNLEDIFDSQNILSNMRFTDRSSHVTITEKFKRGLIFGISPSIGYLVNDTTKVYIKPSVEISSDKYTYLVRHSNSDIVNVSLFEHVEGIYPLKVSFVDRSFDRELHTFKSYSYVKTKVVFVPTVGIERSFDRLRLRVEYAHNCGGKTKTIRYSDNRVMLGMSYAFN